MARQRWLRASGAAAEYVAAAALLVMAVHIVGNALLRSLLNHPLSGTNEYVSYWYLPVVALLGFVAAQRRDQHIEARLLFDRLRHRNRIEVHLAGRIVVLVLCLGFAGYGAQEAVDNWRIGLTGGVSEVVVWPVTFAVPAAFAALAGQTLADMLTTSGRESL
ncbi:TRAP transporter small permease [Haloechinothrix sp. YIM 98757]|uniref:TRAP transporter small permease n=1 Tax=Haloechinothrix aidingensis TaxID=2752311 RepID=A0A838ABF8_9PSEU|nr:TRAP transporter small permease subunit [Haloechinothrix aidingensis]MBA0126573.1 TRAP transporter small permease [Haloechinothrix aidingensis]